MRDKNIIFICQVSESSLAVAKFSGANRRQILGLEAEPLAGGIGDKELIQKLKTALKKLDYRSHRLIFSLPRAKATCRYLKIPTQVSSEVEKIVGLQAARFLPYPANELITTYQINGFDKEGCSEVCLSIAHKDIISRYLNILRELGARDFKIILSSYGLVSLYNYIVPRADKITMVVGAGVNYAEAAVVLGGKLLFSRAFRIAAQQENWQGLFCEELIRTKNGYSKEVLNRPIERIVIMGLPEKITVELLSREIGLSVDILGYKEKIPLAKSLSQDILEKAVFSSSLIGLGLQDMPESVAFLPVELKDARKRFLRQKEALRLALFCLATFFILGFAVGRGLSNKANYLKKLKSELRELEKEAKPLEEIEKKAKLMSGRLQNTLSALDMLYELHQVISDKISLVNFNCEEEKQISLRGQAKELSVVYEFSARLEKAGVFKGFNVKLKYATNKKTAQGEVIDFEIVGAKK